MKRKTLIEIFSSLLALLFVYAACSKLLDYTNFKLQLSKSPFITPFAGWLAWALPMVELGVALLLALPVLRLAGLYLSLFLMSLFTAYLVLMLNFSYYIPCSCGGVLQHMTWKQHIVFNLFFVVISEAAIFLETKQKFLARQTPVII